MNIETERAGFEAAWRRTYPEHGEIAFKRSGLDAERYVTTRVQDGWLMWLARAQQQDPNVRNACELAVKAVLLNNPANPLDAVIAAIRSIPVQGQAYVSIGVSFPVDGKAEQG